MRLVNLKSLLYSQHRTVLQETRVQGCVCCAGTVNLSDAFSASIEMICFSLDCVCALLH